MTLQPLAERSPLGPADVSDHDLALMAAAALSESSVALLECSVTALDFPMFNMTTGGLWRVTGKVRADCGGKRHNGSVLPFSLVVKLVHSPLLWNGIDQVPPEFRDQLAERYPWRTEPEAYRSGLRYALPPELRMPRTYRVTDVDRDSAAIWMEDVPEVPCEWTAEVFGTAAFALGRLAGRTAMARVVTRLQAVRHADTLRFFLEGVGDHVLIPALQGEEIWQHPAVAEAADPAVIAGLRTLAGNARELVSELEALPFLPAHGDASPQNLLPDDDGGFVVIDWGSLALVCPGFDLGQLLAGWVNQGRMHGRELHQLAPLCLQAYGAGLEEEGQHLSGQVIARGLALSMGLFTGLTAVPTQQLAGPDSPALHELLDGRVEMARFILRLLDVTAAAR
jgi:Phosphotransferase enzyme family